MKKTMILALALTLCVSALAGCGAKQAPATANTPPAGTSAPTQASSAAQQDAAGAAPALTPAKDDQDGDGIPDAAEKALGTNPYLWDTNGDGISDKDDKNPGFTENPIAETASTALPIEVKDIRVEDNQTDDHLEMTLRNTGTKELTGFDIYYTVADKKDGTVEGYYQKLDGFSLKSGDTQTLHFDNDTTKAGHFFQNMNGLYGTSANGLVFAGQLHADGYAPMDITVEKSEGTAEVKD